MKKTTKNLLIILVPLAIIAVVFWYSSSCVSPAKEPVVTHDSIRADSVRVVEIPTPSQTENATTSK